MRQNNTSTPSSQLKRGGNLKRTPGIPGQTKKMSGTPGSTQKMSTTPGSAKKIPGASGSINKISGNLGGIKKTSANPGSVSPLIQTQPSLSVASSVSGRAQTPQSRKLSDGLQKVGTKSSLQKTSKFASPRLVRNTMKLANVPSSNSVFHTPGNLSTGSSSSASSASSTKAQKFINAVRRVSRMSSPSDMPNSKPS
jgi:hypothetical protein